MCFRKMSAKEMYCSVIFLPFGWFLKMPTNSNNNKQQNNKLATTWYLIFFFYTQCVTLLVLYDHNFNGRGNASTV